MRLDNVEVVNFLLFVATTVTIRCPLPTQTPYIAAGATNPQTCNPGPCPANYQCVNSGRGFICCSTSASMCTAGVVATNPTTGAAINCMTAACPSGYRCTYSSTYRFYYCCSGGTTVTVTPGGNFVVCRRKNGNLKICTANYF